MGLFNRDGISLGYRFKYRMKKIGLIFGGPAQLDEEHDPKVRLKKQKEARKDAWRREHDQDSQPPQ